MLTVKTRFEDDDKTYELKIPEKNPNIRIYTVDLINEIKYGPEEERTYYHIFHKELNKYILSIDDLKLSKNNLIKIR